MSEEKSTSLIDVMAIPGIPVVSYFSSAEFLAIECICRTIQLKSPYIDLNELQSLKLLKLLKRSPSEVTKCRLSRTGIKIFSKNSYYEVISLVSLEILCSFRYISTSDFGEEFDINHGLFSTLCKARKRGLHVTTPFLSGHDSYRVNSFLKNRYIDCHSEIKVLNIEKTSHVDTVNYALNNHLNKIKEIRIYSFTTEVYLILKKKLDAVTSDGYKPHVFVEIGETHLGLFSGDDNANIQAWLYFISLADSIKLKGYNLDICKKYQAWLTNHPQMLSKITECLLGGLSSDMKPFLDLFKLTLTVLDVDTVWPDLRSFLRLEFVLVLELPEQFLMPESLIHLSIHYLRNFDFACLQDLPQLRMIRLGSSTSISSTVDMRRFKNLESLWIETTKKLEIGKLPPSLKDFCFKGNADSNIPFSVTICSPRIVFRINEEFFHKISFTQEVKHVLLQEQFTLEGPDVFNFASISFKSVKDLLWTKNLNSAKFPILENLRILDRYKSGDQHIQERLLIEIFKTLPKLQRFSFELDVFEISDICQKIEAENSDVSAVKYNRILEVERRKQPT
jgi:hypothetical protein